MNNMHPGLESCAHCGNTFNPNASNAVDASRYCDVFCEREASPDGDTSVEPVVGSIVEITAPWLNTEAERADRYLVLEANGDRFLVQYVCDLPIKPINVFTREMIEVVQ